MLPGPLWKAWGYQYEFQWTNVVVSRRFWSNVVVSRSFSCGWRPVGTRDHFCTSRSPHKQCRHRSGSASSKSFY